MKESFKISKISSILLNSWELSRVAHLCLIQCLFIFFFNQVVYFGDSLCSDSFPAKTYGNWDVVLVLEEMEAEGYHPDLKDVLEPKRKVPKHQVQHE